MNLAQWLEYLEQCHPSNIELGLERVAAVAARLPIDFSRSRIITVGGTNGKGSTVAMLAAILTEAGYSTCCYTSPHLLRYNERVRLGERLASDEELCDSFAAVEAARGETPLTYFEFGTLAALQLFAAIQPDVVILEVGLGGRLDAVNIVDPDLAIVTNVALDHTDWLGDTREAIGFEKAGIFRGGKPALIGEADIPRTVLDHAAAIGAAVYANGQAFKATLRDDDTWDWTGRSKDGNPVSLDGLPVNDFPLANGATVIQALMLLVPDLDAAAVRAGFAHTHLPGRFQQVDRGFPLVLDVAHNPHAARRLVELVRTRFPEARVHIVIAMLADKNYREVLDILATLAPRWTVAGIQDQRGLAGKILYNYLLEGGATDVSCHTTVAEAFAAAESAVRESANESAAEGAGQDLLLVTGSFFTVTAVLELI